MTFLERFGQKNKIISFIVKLQNSALYPALFALICAASGVSDKRVYIPCIALLSLFTIFGGLFSPDLKVFIVPAFMFYYALGMDMPPERFQYYCGFPKFDSSSLPFFLTMLLLILAVLFYRLIANGFIKELISRRGMTFWSIICLDAALILGGAFSSFYTLGSFAFGLLLAVSLTFFYLLFSFVFSHSEDGMAYACKALVFTGFLVLAQLLYISLRLNEFGNLYHISGNSVILNRDRLHFSWGPATIVGGVLVPPIAAALWLMRNRKLPLLSLASALLFLSGTVLINTRSAMLVGLAVLICGLLFCCLGGKNKKINRITVISLLGAGCIAALIFVLRFPNTYKSIIDKLLDIMRLGPDIENQGDISDFLSGRPKLWLEGFRDFLGNPFFGTGFAYGYFTPGSQSSNPFSNMYHNIFVQFLGSMGIVGIGAFIFHMVQLIKVSVLRFSVDKLLLLLVPASILAMSLADNFFFQPNFTIFYVAFIAAAEFFISQVGKKES